ncbi:MAG: hypothetical protein ABSH05_17760 [Bryobacteraceae bacterium]
MSKTATELLKDGLRRGLPYRDIASGLLALGEPVAERTICRRSLEFRAERARFQALKWLGRVPVGIWPVEDFVALIERMDLSDGWYLRARKRALKILRRFFDEPTGQTIRKMEEELLAFAVQSHIARRRPRKTDRDGAVLLPERGSGGISASSRLSKEGGLLG